MRQPRGHEEMIEFGHIICDMNGHNMGVVLSSSENTTMLRALCGDILINIEISTRDITMKDGKFSVNFRLIRPEKGAE